MERSGSTEQVFEQRMNCQLLATAGTMAMAYAGGAKGVETKKMEDKNTVPDSTSGSCSNIDTKL